VLDAGSRHLSSCGDPVMEGLVATIGPDGLRERSFATDHYGSLVRSIVGQQVSTKAAAAIFRRLTDRFGGRTPTPQEVLADDPEELRAAAGLSGAKLRYLYSLAQHIEDGSLQLERLDSLDDDAVLRELTAVKGIGPWSAQIFLMFHLGRPDVLPVGDLGIRKAMMQLYALEVLPLAPAMEEISQPWRPYRTMACRYLWETLHNEPA
jgi:DNA-3-methyladenine glycosylase II